MIASAQEVPTGELQELSHRLADVLFEQTTAVMSGSVRPNLRLVGCGSADIARGIAAWEARIPARTKSLQVRIPFDPIATQQHRSHVANGQEFDLVVAPAALRANPILSSVFPWLRVAPVFTWLFLLDEAAVVLEGALTPNGETTAWLSDEGEVLQLALDLWHQTYAVSVAVLGDEKPPLSARQIAAAAFAARGATTAHIARELSVSARTVVSDLRRVCTLVGANGRAEMTAVLLATDLLG